MGTFHPEVTIRKGLKRVVRHARVAKKKQGGRAIDDMTVVEIRRMVVGPAVGGELVVKSSNVLKPTLGAEWTPLAKERIADRLRDSDGGKKGRVLYGELECSNTHPVAVCAVCLHIERADEIMITSFDHTRELATWRTTLFEMMLLAVERVACENNKGHPVTIVVDVPKDEAGWYKERFGFTQLRPHPYGKSRRLLGLRHGGCREKKRAVAGLVQVEQPTR